jgi:putative membrane protein
LFKRLASMSPSAADRPVLALSTRGGPRKGASAHGGRSRSIAVVVAVGVALAGAPASIAMASPATLADNPLSMWDFGPSVLVPTLLVCAVYVCGLMRRPGVFDEKPWRNMAFIWGVIAIFLSLASPIDALADHLFFVHQIQHMLIRVVGPMLIALGQPQATLIAGLPRWIRRRVLSPVAGSGLIRSTGRFLTGPVMVTSLFVGSLYIWQWPPLHDLAILNEGVHYAMHLTMLTTGLLFFWRVFDQRPTPKGTRFGVRLMMLWIAVLANIPIGAYITFKTHELYPAYDVAGRLFGMTPLEDEGLGGFIMWAPTSMMMLVALLLVVHAWGVHETAVQLRREASVAAGIVEAQAQTGLETSRPGNRALAFGLLAFAACVLGATVAIGVLSLHGAGSASHQIALGPPERAAVTR